MKAIALFLALITPAFGGAEIFEQGGIFVEGQESVPDGVTLQSLMTMSNDRDNLMANISLMVDKNQLVAGMFASQVRSKRSRPSEVGQVFWLRDIESRSGAVLAQAQGKDIIILQGRLERESQQGKFVLRYLANGLTGRYETCEFNLRRGKDGWWVQNAYSSKRVTSAHVITSTFGVKTIQGICK